MLVPQNVTVDAMTVPPNQLAGPNMLCAHPTCPDTNTTLLLLGQGSLWVRRIAQRNARTEMCTWQSLMQGLIRSSACAHRSPLLERFKFQERQLLQQQFQAASVELPRVCQVTAHDRQQLLVDCKDLVQRALVDVQRGQSCM